MKCQISVEMLLYMSISLGALMFGMNILHGGYDRFGLSLREYEMGAFAAGLNNALASASSGSFELYLPKGACNATFSLGSMHTPYGNFSLVSGISLNGKALCPDGMDANLSFATTLDGIYLTRR